MTTVISLLQLAVRTLLVIATLRLRRFAQVRPNASLSLGFWTSVLLALPAYLLLAAWRPSSDGLARFVPDLPLWVWGVTVCGVGAGVLRWYGRHDATQTERIALPVLRNEEL
jgi:hypothetical protein